MQETIKNYTARLLDAVGDDLKTSIETLETLINQSDQIDLDAFKTTISLLIDKIGKRKPHESHQLFKRLHILVHEHPEFDPGEHDLLKEIEKVWQPVALRSLSATIYQQEYWNRMIKAYHSNSVSVEKEKRN